MTATETVRRRPAAAAEWVLTGGVRVRCTGWAQGDMAGSDPAVERRRRAVVDRPWTVLRQIHGARVVSVDFPGHRCGEEADGAVTAISGAALAVLTADCAPVALASPEGVAGVAHAGWRGLRGGVIEAAVQAMRRAGATRVDAVLGPCIHPCCYAFSDADLTGVESRLAARLRAVTRQGELALDLPAAVRVALHAVGANLVGEAEECTACSGGFWSWRAGAAHRRQATVVWRE